MSRIAEKIKEVENLDIEIKNLSKSLKKLRDRKKSLENDIQTYMENNNKQGLRYKGKSIISHERNILENPRRKKSEKEHDGISVLHKYGIGPTMSKNVLDEIVIAMKGPKTNKKILRISEL